MVAIVIYAGLPRILSVSSGLPYYHYWDEPVTATGALVSMKTNNFFPHGQGLVYGGALRYPLMLVDFIYYQYLKLSPDYEVENKSDIKTYLEGVFKTSSHSGFYFWSRAFVVLINVLGFLFVFAIGRLRGGYTMGFIGVILLASIFTYYERSFLVNVDLPLSTWMLGAIFFSLKFNRDKNRRHLFFSLICVGLAAATKYTGALTFIIPLSAAILNREEFALTKTSDVIKSILKWSGISFAVFAILNPVVIVFPDRMYKIMIWIGMVYRTGQGHFAKEPGLEHLSYQTGELIQNYGLLFSLISLAGFLLGLVKLTNKKFWLTGSNAGFIIIVLFPCFYLLYVTSIYTIAYHRNFSLMYPILAILTAEASISLVGLLSSLSILLAKYRFAFNLLTIAIFFYLSFSGYASILNLSKRTYDSIETRTKAIFEINKITEGNPEIFLGIADDLLISPEDLRKLKVDYGFFSISDIDSALHGFTHLLLPDYNSNLQVQNFDSLQRKVDAHIKQREQNRISGHNLDVPATLSHLESPIFNPTVITIKGEDFPPSRMKDYIRPLMRKEASTIVSNDPVEIFSVKLDPGSYRLLFESRGDSAAGEYPIFKIQVEVNTIATITTSQDYAKYQLEFRISKTERVHIFATMINDYYDAERGLDRNIFLRRIELWPLKMINNAR